MAMALEHGGTASSSTSTPQLMQRQYRRGACSSGNAVACPEWQSVPVPLRWTYSCRLTSQRRWQGRRDVPLVCAAFGAACASPSLRCRRWRRQHSTRVSPRKAAFENGSEHPEDDEDDFDFDFPRDALGDYEDEASWFDMDPKGAESAEPAHRDDDEEPENFYDDYPLASETDDEIDADFEKEVERNSPWASWEIKKYEQKQLRPGRSEAMTGRRGSDGGALVKHSGDDLEPNGEEVDYMELRQQSPSEIRKAGMWCDASRTTAKAKIAEVTSPSIATGSKKGHGSSEGGLQCKSLFGEGDMRRRQRGFTDLAWPIPHIWLSSGGKLARIATILNKRAQEVKNLRLVEEHDMYLGEWMAPDVYPLHVNMRELPKFSAQELPPRLPALGSSAAAAELPILRTARSLAVHPLWADDGNMNGEELPLSGPARRLLCVAHQASASAEVLPGSASRVSAMALAALEVATLSAGQGSGDSDDETGETGASYNLEERIDEDIGAAARSCADILHMVAKTRALKESAFMEVAHYEDMLSMRAARLQETHADLSEEQIGALLQRAMMPSSKSSVGSSQLREAAQQDLAELWMSVAFPNGRQTVEKLTELAEDITMLEQADRERVTEAVSVLQHRAAAALDVVLRLAQPLEESPSGEREESRVSNDRSEISWYDSRMPVAAFHVDDVTRYKDLVLFPDPETREEGSTSLEDDEDDEDDGLPNFFQEGSTSLEGYEDDGLYHYIEAPGDDGAAADDYLERLPSPKDSGNTDMRYHIPLQDSERMGCAGGARPLEIGEVIPTSATRSLMAFAAIRPRPPGALIPLPSNMNMEGCMHIGSGGQALQQVLSRMDPALHSRAARRRLLHFQIAQEVDSALQTPIVPGKIPQGTEYPPSLVRDSLLKAGKALDVQHSHLRSMLHKGTLPEWSVLLDLPIMPPDLRASASVSGPGESDPHDMDDLYRGVIKSADNVRLAAKQRQGGSNLTRYLLQQHLNAVDAVIDNPRAKTPVTKSMGQTASGMSQGEPLASIAKRIKGKKGKLRLNLLGKRVDYSCRSVIVSEPELKLDEVGLPFELVEVLFEPFLRYELAKQHHIARIKLDDKKFEDLRLDPESSIDPTDREKLSDRRKLFKEFFNSHYFTADERWDLLRKVVGTRHVFINRAPTLHRLSVQSMQPVVYPGQAIRLHPLITSPFNADFDGDTMTVHLGLSDEAQEELKAFMRTSKNLYSPADGDPVIGPTQDMVLGLYYLTAECDSEEIATAEPQKFDSVQAVLDAYAAKSLGHFHRVTLPAESLHQLNEAFAKDVPGLEKEGDITLTVGRVVFFAQLATRVDAAHRPGVQQRELEQTVSWNQRASK